jgi:hypothetical protein
LDKAVMMSFFTERLSDMGRASEDWLRAFTDSFSTPPVLNWAKAGCYIVAKGNPGFVLKHVSGAKVPPQIFILSFAKPNSKYKP